MLITIQYSANERRRKDISPLSKVEMNGIEGNVERMRSDGCFEYLGENRRNQNGQNSGLLGFTAET